MIPAVQAAIHYTHFSTTTETQFIEVQTNLATAIDLLRGVLKNVRRSGKTSLYPYENLKDIREIVSRLRFGAEFGKEFSPAAARDCVVELWREMHSAMLLKFDREEPLDPVSKYLSPGKSGLADDLFAGKGGQ